MCVCVCAYGHSKHIHHHAIYIYYNSQSCSYIILLLSFGRHVAFNSCASILWSNHKFSVLWVSVCVCMCVCLGACCISVYNMRHVVLEFTAKCLYNVHNSKWDRDREFPPPFTLFRCYCWSWHVSGTETAPTHPQAARMLAAHSDWQRSFELLLLLSPCSLLLIQNILLEICISFHLMLVFLLCCRPQWLRLWLSLLPIFSRFVKYSGRANFLSFVCAPFAFSFEICALFLFYIVIRVFLSTWIFHLFLFVSNLLFLSTLFFSIAFAHTAPPPRLSLSRSRTYALLSLTFRCAGCMFVLMLNGLCSFDPCSVFALATHIFKVESECVHFTRIYSALRNLPYGWRCFMFFCVVFWLVWPGIWQTEMQKNDPFYSSGHKWWKSEMQTWIESVICDRGGQRPIRWNGAHKETGNGIPTDAREKERLGKWKQETAKMEGRGEERLRE